MVSRVLSTARRNDWAEVTWALRDTYGRLVRKPFIDGLLHWYWVVMDEIGNPCDDTDDGVHDAG